MASSNHSQAPATGFGPALIFMPDISGFTSFIHNTELVHSRHIIGELLELLIDEDQLDLSVSEIEGDAVLFYRFGEAPSLEAIARQVRKMYLAFHRHLKVYERDRICECGACTTTNALSIKFVAYYGEITTMKVKQFLKLLGEGVIVAHKLLKNNLGEKEYVLMGGDFPAFNGIHSNRDLEWVKMQQGKTSYTDVGQVDYQYFLLDSLQREVGELPPREKPNSYNNPLLMSTTVHAPVDFVHKIITDQTLKPKWVTGLKEIEEDPYLVPRIGSEHMCVFPSSSIHLQTAVNESDGNRLIYAEKQLNPKALDATVFYYMEEQGAGSTQFSIELHYRKFPIIGSLLDPLMRRFFSKQFGKNLDNFKLLCEKLYAEKWEPSYVL